MVERSEQSKIGNQSLGKDRNNLKNSLVFIKAGLQKAFETKEVLLELLNYQIAFPVAFKFQGKD